MISEFPARQVHLDFHTSELIPGVGGKFEKEQFQEALRVGHVNSITVFAKCHHSWCYYPTEVGQEHPTLTIDLLGGQIAACHEIGVRVPIYFTVGWSANDAEQHPEWCARKKDGEIETANYDPTAQPTDKRPIVSWKFVCPSGEYRKLIVEQTREICENYAVDGFFYDICGRPICYCEQCREGMRAAGLDSEKEEDAKQYNVLKWRQFMSDCNAVIHSVHPQATVFYNGTTRMDGPKALLEPQTHYEMEDLPTTWGGYDKLPLRSKFFITRGKPILAMSGKFHTSWGEFGGFKHPDAIRYEAASMIAFGAACSFGDQAHPSGEMDMATYRNIGEAYKYVEQIESYGLNGQPFSNLGLYLCGSTPHDQGVVNMLLEKQMDFEVATPESDLSRYATVILPGGQCLDEGSAEGLNRYLEEGGSLLVLAESALDARKGKLLLDVGGIYLGPARYENDYLVVGEALGEGLVASPFLCYSAALRFEATDGEVLASIREPYFDRTYAHYCSHQNTPYQLVAASHAGALQKGRVVYLPHALGAMYYEHGARLHRDLFINALKRIYTGPVFSAVMPSAGRVSFLHQPQQRRYAAHLLYAPALQRGRCLVIEDLVPLYKVALEVRVPERIQAVRLPLKQQELDFVRDGEVVRVTVPEVNCHQIIVFTY